MNLESDFDKGVLTQIGGMIECVKNLQKSIEHSRNDANERFKSLMEDASKSKESFDTFKVAVTAEFSKVKIDILKLQLWLIGLAIIIVILVAPTNPFVASIISKYIPL